ncbi:protein RUFY3-like [Protopterus annectens]|uniref:protein RUFY3-like n=1 Tax=Protopterus annectens TaxID=7888 RepID=UPI001CFAA3C1|nr:protein RUFY3-like [Protopterus annectens]
MDGIWVLPETEERRSSSEGTKDPVASERLNLLHMVRQSIKGLLDPAFIYMRTLDINYPPLMQFFVVMEHCLKHGLKVKKTFLGQNKSFWGPLELVEKLVPEAAEIATSVKELPGIRTPVGRARAWLRLALMQKKLSDYMKALINRKDLLSEFYEPSALMMEEESAVIVGLLVGLNVIDANFCLKGHDLDSQVGVVDFSLCLKNWSQESKAAKENEKLSEILDQKNYIEEVNRQLSATISNLQTKVDSLEKSNARMTEELAVANNQILTLQKVIQQAQRQNINYPDADCKVTREDGSDRQGLTETKKQLKEETQLRLDVERELEVQIGMKQEMELAMKMLEKDICEKQDAIVSLRQQLDETRVLNHELTLKVQNSDSALKQKNDLIKGLEEKMHQMVAVTKQLEQRLRQTEKDRQSAVDATRLFKSEFGDKIASLQQEVECLTVQRNQLEQKLKNEWEIRSVTQNGSQGNLSSASVSVGNKQQPALVESLKIKVLDICQLCQEEASLTKRKNVCKNCRGIFCETCSANKLPLPSSINPECVCNPCHKQLLDQYSSSPLLKDTTDCS